MIKQTLMFTSPVALSLKYGQLVVKSIEDDKTLTRPVEDIGFVIIDNPMISLTIPLLNELAENNVAVIICDKKQIPQAMLQPLVGNGDIINIWGKKEKDKKEKDKKDLPIPVQLEIIW